MFVGNVNMLNNNARKPWNIFLCSTEFSDLTFFFGVVLKWYFSKGEHLGEHCSFYTIIIFLIEIL